MIYIAENKIDWYNENGLHSLVLDALYPVVVTNLVVDKGAILNKKQKGERDNHVIQSKYLSFFFFSFHSHII